MTNSAMRTALFATSALAALAPSVAEAQDRTNARAAASTDDIIVTARRRDETSIAVPVVLTAVSGAELTRRGISSADAVAQLVPGLTILGSGGASQGGTIALRGVSGPDTNPLGDQAVSFNIDGVQVAKSSVRRLAFMDLQQIEVLKGPQSLFFGKNSPAGIISIRTADPTPNFQAKASVGYEFNAQEWRGEGFVSGPLTDTLGARLAIYGSDLRGWVKNDVPANSISPPFHRYGPRNREIALRGTLKFEPTDAFTARLKVSYGKAKGAGPAENAQIVNCPFGSTQFPGIVSDCKANNRNERTDNISTVFTPYEPKFGDGHTRAAQEQILAGLELNYKLSDSIDLTSVTGFYKSKFATAEHFSRYPVVPFLQFGFSFGLPALASYYFYNNREISQELRANSHFDGPLNFTVGGIYSDTRSSVGQHAFINQSNPAEISQFFVVQDGVAYSGFAQARFDVTPQLELSAGGRYSHEKKSLPAFMVDLSGSRTNPMVPFATPVKQASFNDFSPELTATYRPTEQLTLFGSYKRGFLSGGFNGSGGIPGLPLNYDPQKIKGFEGGVKALLLDGALRTNLSLFNYKVTGLQITAFNGAGVGSIRNAGGVRTKGVEFDLNYRSPIEGLTLRGALSYNKANYLSYYGPCWRGQSQAQGCNFRAVGNGISRPILPGEIGNNQDLAGRQLINAPEWSGNAGASYETPLGAALKLGLSADITFAGGSPTDASLTPALFSPKRALIDATARIAEAKDSWEVALIGRNLTNKFYWAGGQQLGFTGGASGTVAGGPAADGYAVLNRGREIMLRVTVAFGQ
ncbi:TonB-dependent receptor [Sphingobium sp. AN558]|uniref:TonB-dependent receptor n=1 Tax=Sphingobium sp. AN558 TaxID=3133442 RepID=UPI0030C4B26A